MWIETLSSGDFGVEGEAGEEIGRGEGDVNGISLAFEPQQTFMMLWMSSFMCTSNMKYY